MIHQIIPISSLSLQDIATSARVMFDQGHSKEDCPYPEGSEQAAVWLRNFIRCEIEKMEEIA